MQQESEQPSSSQDGSQGGARLGSQLGVDQKQRLLRAKLVALMRALGEISAEQSPLVETRGALTGSVQGGSAHIAIEFGTPESVAGAVSWAVKENCERLTLFVDFDAALAARFASYFGPEATSSSDLRPPQFVQVREVRGANSFPVEPEPIGDQRLADERPRSSDTDPLIDLMRASDLEIVTEHGVTRGEILGLEVARLVLWPQSAGGDGEEHLEVGVGRFDRDAVWAVKGGNDMEAALAETVAMVRRHRFPGAPPHPLQRLSRERWLRSILIRDPSLVGARSLGAVAMTTEAAGMKDAHPAGAVGLSDSGEPIVVVCSVGVDLAAVPLAADLRASLGAEAQLVLALPGRDIHPIQERLASMLIPRAQVVAVPTEWD